MVTVKGLVLIHDDDDNSDDDDNNKAKAEIIWAKYCRRIKNNLPLCFHVYKDYPHAHHMTGCRNIHALLQDIF